MCVTYVSYYATGKKNSWVCEKLVSYNLSINAGIESACGGAAF